MKFNIYGNLYHFRSTINVPDYVRPTAIIKDITVQLNTLVKVTFSVFDKGLADNVEMASYVLYQSTFD